MKENSQKLLLALFPSSDESFFRLKQEITRYVIPSLSPDGTKSLIYHLEKKGMLEVMRLHNETYLSCTRHGVKLLRGLFPALRIETDVDDGWQCVIFKKAPKGDPQFRYLRTRLLSDGAIALTRGMYITPQGYSEGMLHTIESLYVDSVVMFTVKEWLFGSERPIVMKEFHILDTIEAYSRTSNELFELLSKIESKKGLIEKKKDVIRSLYERFFEIVREDRGLSPRYFPNEISCTHVLHQFQQLLRL